MKLIIYLIGLISSAALSVGILFRILNWPGANELVLYGFLAFTLVFVPSVVISQLKLTRLASRTEKIKVALGFASACIAGVSVIFKMLHLQGADVLLLVGVWYSALAFCRFCF